MTQPALDLNQRSREVIDVIRCRVYSERVWPGVRMFDRARLLSVLSGAVGAFVAVAVMEAFSIRREFPLWAIPFATSIVTVLGMPEAKPAQPRALIGGHLISTLVGLIVVKMFGPDPWAAAVAVGLSMIAMHLSDTFHPPAGIDPLIVVVNDMSWGFLFVPVGLGSLLLTLFAFAWHKLVARGPDNATSGRSPRGHEPRLL